MRKNVGTWDALFRITLGLAGLAWSISRMARLPYRSSGFTRFILWMSAMKVAEGITRFCPMLFAFNMNSEGITIRWKNPGKQQASLLFGEEAQEEQRQTAQHQGAPRPLGHSAGKSIRARQLGKPRQLQ